MKDPIIQEIREIRAEIAADFDFDMDKFFIFVRQHEAAEKQAGHRLPFTTPRRQAAQPDQSAPAAISS